MEMQEPYIRFSKEQLDKIGNTIIYLSKQIPLLSKTKLLKLLYILDELSVKQSGIPFLNLKYKVWKFGPVSEEIFVDLSSETTLLKKFIRRSYTSDEQCIIIPIIDFNDDEFSDNDIRLMDNVIKKFGDKTARELIEYTHRENSLWYNAAKNNDVLDFLLNETITNTEVAINLIELVENDPIKKQIFEEYQESH